MAKRTPKQNEQRRLRAEFIRNLTGNKELANRARDWSNETFNDRVKDYLEPKLTERQLQSFLLPTKEVKEKKKLKTKVTLSKVIKHNKDVLIDIDSIKDVKQLGTLREKYKTFYRIAREAGYTPAESKRVMTFNLKDLKDYVSANKVFSKEQRHNRWRMMSRKGQKLDPYLADLAEQINIDNGFDPSSKYGFGVVHAWYTNGGEIKNYIFQARPDSKISDIYYGLEKYKYKYKK